ncbi:helix-turn-helix transcriptional regulator [Amycolatopsis coloradensis]|uniref:helix-turn-helix transcriptional regulator n=2 Tax=Amycolatopsis coloradensis TaxID=76021 RepID=UPI000A009C50|nr:LuxR family transcriptional regulator [Amycolatopsis coloradensis]
MEEPLPPELRELLAGIDATPAGPVRAVLSGPPGHGKTTALAAVARHYRDAGVTVITREDLLPSTVASAVAILLDDVDSLPPRTGQVLAGLAGAATRMVLTHTPGAAGAMATGLVTATTRHIRLPAWNAADVARFAGGRIPAERAQSIRRLTAGVPRLVTRCLQVPTVEELIDELRAELDMLGEPGLTYLVVAAVGGARDVELLGTALGRSRDHVPGIVDQVRAAGLLAANDSVPPLVARAVRDHVGIDRVLTVLVRLLEDLLRTGQPVLPIARELERLGAGGAIVRAGLEAAAAEAVHDEPAVAAELYAAAARGGSPRSRLAPGWAHAAVLAGHHDVALRLADELLSAAEPAHRSRGALVAGTIMTRRGDLARGAELLRWSKEPGAVPLVDLAGIALGETTTTERSVLTEPVPAYGDVAGRLLDGIRDSVGGHTEVALTTLLAAADAAEATDTGHLLPDSPAALTALVALHAAEFDLAHGVLSRAAPGIRHTLLLGWTELLRGDLAAAETHRSAAAGHDGSLTPRDVLFLHALELGLVRRGDTPGAFRTKWASAYEAMMRQPVDLFTLLPLGELLVAAARMKEGFRVEAHRGHAFALLARHGRPALWSAWLDWSVFHAAIVAGDREGARVALRQLADQPAPGHLASAFAAAGTKWLSVLGGSVQVDTVLAAAGGLHRAGLRWDAARLAGHAAVRATDRAVMVTLLRAAKHFPLGSGPSADQQPPPPTEAPSLTPRETDIGRLVIDGYTYREIGERLHISSKTVEHHMARIRGKLGATDRRTITALLGNLLGKSG